ncbi:MAG: hypothetical protein NWS01_08955 [Burkholderiales bacterium]|nr:hypothetical protein [Burkholderiales bacterium]
MKYVCDVGIAVGTEESNSGVARQPCAPSAQQVMFIRGVLNGKTQKQAYRDAYPADCSNDRNICVTANRLLHSPKIEAFVQYINSNVEDLLVEDRRETRRFVFMELIALSKQAKGERHKIKALELLGKSCGAFKPADRGAGTAPSEQALKYALAEHLCLLGDVRD